MTASRSRALSAAMIAASASGARFGPPQSPARAGAARDAIRAQRPASLSIAPLKRGAAGRPNEFFASVRDLFAPARLAGRRRAVFELRGRGLVAVAAEEVDDAVEDLVDRPCRLLEHHAARDRLDLQARQGGGHVVVPDAGRGGAAGDP